MAIVPDTKDGTWVLHLPGPERGRDVTRLRPDRVLGSDVTGRRA